MNILVTGGFGNIGMAVLAECLERGHRVAAFDLPSRRNRRLARRWGRRGVESVLGDLRRPEDLARAVEGREAVIHLAAILPPASEERPELCRAVNAGGTANLIGAMRERAPGAALVAVSSAGVMGPTQARTPPVRPEDPLAPSDAYSRSKIEAEAAVSSSGLRHCVLRLAAVLPTTLDPAALIAMVKLIFDMPLEARCEVVLDLDVAFALVQAAEDLAGSGELSGQRGFIAGGASRGCQITTRGLVGGLFEPLGLGFPDQALFPSSLDSYYLDWYDTGRTQAILGYQRHELSQWRDMILRRYRLALAPLRMLRGPVLRWIEGQSPRHAPR